MLELSGGIDISSLGGKNALGIAASRLHDTNIYLVKFMLDKGIAADARKDGDSPTALHCAILSHDFHVIHALLKADTDVNLLWGRKSTISTALGPWEYNLASRARIVFDAWKLFQSSIDFDQYSSGSFVEFKNVQKKLGIVKYSMLWTAARRKCIKAAQVRGEERANVALAIAAVQWQQNSFEIVRILLEAGADPNLKDEKAPTPLQIAARSGSAPLVRILLNAKADVNVAPSWVPRFIHENYSFDKTSTALQASIINSSNSFNINIVHLLLDHDADINAPAPPGRATRTALQAAIDRNNIELIQLRLERGADINAPAGPDRGVTALQAAIIRGYLSLAAQLLEAGANVNAPDSPIHGRTALEGAAEMGRLDMVRLLLNAGAGIDEDGSPSYETALQFAKREGHRVVHDLIKLYFDNKFESYESSVDDVETNTACISESIDWDPNNTEWGFQYINWDQCIMESSVDNSETNTESFWEE